jgi:GDP-L-fucose synthase
MCRAYNLQYGTHFSPVMPTNLYSPKDNYDLQSLHVVAALIRKCHEAKVSGGSSVIVWGSGTLKREFLYSDDAAEGCLFLMDLPQPKFQELMQGVRAVPVVNIDSGEDVTISDLAHTIAEVGGFEGELLLDCSKPDGTPRKLLNVSLLNSLGWRPGTSLRDGLVAAYEDFCLQFGQNAVVRHAAIETTG